MRDHFSHTCARSVIALSTVHVQALDPNLIMANRGSDGSEVESGEGGEGGGGGGGGGGGNEKAEKNKEKRGG